MLKKLLVLAAVALLFIAVGCSNGTTPTTPGTHQSMADFFGSMNKPGPAVAKFTYTSKAGQVLESGTLGRNKDGQPVSH